MLIDKVKALKKATKKQLYYFIKTYFVILLQFFLGGGERERTGTDNVYHVS